MKRIHYGAAALQRYVDHEALTAASLGRPLEDMRERTVPEGHVFVMGDNRPMSQDARCWSTHSVEESAIVGRAFIRIWPLSEITLF